MRSLLRWCLRIVHEWLDKRFEQHQQQIWQQNHGKIHAYREFVKKKEQKTHAR